MPSAPSVSPRGPCAVECSKSWVAMSNKLLQRTPAHFGLSRHDAQPGPAPLSLFVIIPFERKPNLTLRRIRMPTEEHKVPHRGFEIRSAIPVLRMFDEAK